METTILPITVIVAVVIFLIKEARDLLGNHQNRKRQVLAIKNMLADEIEKNNFTIATLRRTLISIKNNHNINSVSLERTSSGSLRIEFKEAGQESGSGWPIRNVSNVIFDKLYVQLASLDIDLFNKSKDAYESLSEVDHIRSSLIDNIEDHEWPSDSYWESFVDYGLDELADAYVALTILYKECTGNDLDKHKIRAFA